MLLFHGFHVCGQLHRQKCRRFPPTGDNIQHGLTLYPESKQYGICLLYTSDAADD